MCFLAKTTLTNNFLKNKISDVPIRPGTLKNKEDSLTN